MDSRLFFFGFPHVEVDGRPITVERRKVFGLLAYLVLNTQLHSREALATLFWPELDQTRSLAALRRALVDLKNLIPAEALDVTRQSIALRPAANVWIDVKAFDELIRTNREQVRAESLRSLSQAVQLYHADFLSGFTLEDSPEFDTWQMIEHESLRLKFG